MSVQVDGNNWKLLRVRVMLVTTSRHGRIFCFKASRALRLTTATWMLFAVCKAAIKSFAGRFYAKGIDDAQVQCEITVLSRCELVLRKAMKLFDDKKASKYSIVFYRKAGVFPPRQQLAATKMCKAFAPEQIGRA
ncbi:MAG: hypothetical protein RR194_04230 [Ruthenibacterium sp.]